ncbi:hypothetical protein KIW84_062745 [Lathyrus oleraceus]|uniref:C-JID domain-containing protein n=1 Tax=Pisum sativum TaxID=3888 RepID=A0A9D4W824_PEA|nr:hypothetical protein KIW84_062745 [Pisum sativum]
MGWSAGSCEFEVISLSGCKNLVELSDLSLASKPEKVHLDDCTSLLNVPSYILSLDSLLAINLRGCKQLCYIESEKQSKSLRWLNLRGCSRLTKYSVVSEELKYSNLDCIAIEELPDNINLLLKLNKLSLRGSNIETLPGSIQYLSLLRALDVSNCRRLRSLPKLLFLLQDLNVSNCISLVIVSNLGMTMLQDSFGRLKKRTLLRQIQEEEKMAIRHQNYLGRFEFHNCMKLDQIAGRTVLEEALIRIQLAAYLSSKFEECYETADEVSDNFHPEDFVHISRPFYSILVGNEIPYWFMHKKTDSLVIIIELSPLLHLRNRFLGFAFCLVLGASESNRKNIRSTSLMAGNFTRNFPWKVSFEFFVLSGISGSMVKQCGIRPLYSPFGIMQSLNEEVSIEAKRAYHDFEYNRIPMEYWLLRYYAHPLDRLGFPSKQPGFLSVIMENLRNLHHQPRDLRRLAQLFLNDYCYFGELLDNIDIFSSLRSLWIHCCNIESLPARIRNLSRLEYLKFYDCKRLRSISKLPPSLETLLVVNCTSLETVEFSEEYIRHVFLDGTFLNGMTHMVHEKVSRIQVTDPETNVIDWWSMEKYGPSRANISSMLLHV